MSLSSRPKSRLTTPLLLKTREIQTLRTEITALKQNSTTLSKLKN